MVFFFIQFGPVGSFSFTGPDVKIRGSGKKKEKMIHVEVKV